MWDAWCSPVDPTKLGDKAKVDASIRSGVRSSKPPLFMHCSVLRIPAGVQQKLPWGATDYELCGRSGAAVKQADAWVLLGARRRHPEPAAVGVHQRKGENGRSDP